MAKSAERSYEWRIGWWRIVPWSMAAGLLLLPLIAMQFTDEVAWDGADFVFFAVLLGGTGGALELAALKSRDIAYRVGAGVALLAVFFLIWVNGAVGIIGDEGEAANLLFAGVIAVALVGAFIARFRPGGMVIALVAAAACQATIGAIALVAGWGSTGASWPLDIVFATGFFTVLWLLSAWLFRQAATRG